MSEILRSGAVAPRVWHERNGGRSHITTCARRTTASLVLLSFHHLSSRSDGSLLVRRRAGAQRSPGVRRDGEHPAVGRQPEPERASARIRAASPILGGFGFGFGLAAGIGGGSAWSATLTTISFQRLARFSAPLMIHRTAMSTRLPRHPRRI